jgi:hypothetical protein
VEIRLDWEAQMDQSIASLGCAALKLTVAIDRKQLKDRLQEVEGEKARSNLNLEKSYEGNWVIIGRPYGAGTC